MASRWCWSTHVTCTRYPVGSPTSPTANGCATLHSVGLLRGSFRPANEVCALRSVLRHRDTLIKTAARSVLHMQKAYSQMNVHP